MCRLRPQAGVLNGFSIQQVFNRAMFQGVIVTPSSNPDAVVLRRNGFIAEIIPGKNQQPQIFHYVVQREHSTGIVYWGQEVSHQRAMECVEDFLKQYDAKEA